MPIHVGDVGVQVELSVSEDGAAVDLTTATQPEMHLRDPNGVTLTRTASIVAPNKLRYASDVGDFTTPGQWEIRGHFALDAWRGATTALYVTVSRV